MVYTTVGKQSYKIVHLTLLFVFYNSDLLWYLYRATGLNSVDLFFYVFIRYHIGFIQGVSKKR